MIQKFSFLGMLAILAFSCQTEPINEEVTLKEIRTASNDAMVVFFATDTLDVNAISIDEKSAWTINGEPVEAIYKYATEGDPCDHHIYLKTNTLKEGKKYTIETPYGTKKIRFREREIFCESIKTNQVGYSALSKTRYANFAIWLGTGGSQKIEGELPDYEVISTKDKKVVASGKLQEIGEDEGSGDFVYRIDLSGVPEGGPFKVVVKGVGSSYPFGVGGEFSKYLAYTIFRAQYMQRCGCPIDIPEIRKDPCHTLIYDVDGPIGEANIDVVGDEPTFTMYGGYHDAGDADRRAYHMSNPILNMMIWEAFPECFTDNQYDIPGEFTEDFHIKSYTNDIPDIIDEAEWGTLAWEYLQNEDGKIQFGTETRGYAEPFVAPYNRDIKKYGTVKTDPRATCTGAGLFMHLARIIKPYNEERALGLIEKAERAKNAGDEVMADPERLYYHIQRYLLLQEETDHQKIREMYKIAGALKENLWVTPGYSLNNEQFDNPAYIFSYIVAKDVPTDSEIVAFFKQAIHEAADVNLEELHKHAYPLGNNPEGRSWGHNVRQPQYAAAPLLWWKLSGDQKYFDAASQLMDYKVGLNPIGISYVTGLGFHQVHNIHDRESAYTKSLGWGPKPGITAFGPGVTGWRSRVQVVPALNELPKERQYVDNMETINFNEFTIFETMHYDALYTVLAGGGKWNGENPYK